MGVISGARIIGLCCVIAMAAIVTVAPVDDVRSLLALAVFLIGFLICVAIMICRREN